MATVSGIWLWNETLTKPSSGLFPAINFVSNGIAFGKIGHSYGNTNKALLFYFDTSGGGYTQYTVYEGKVTPPWVKGEEYRTIDFGSEPQELDDTFYSWMEANATYVGASGPISTISGITINPTHKNIARGEPCQFTATVEGTEDFDPSVTWSVSSEYATIEDGLLTVGVEETNPFLTVTATSVQDESIFATASITLVAATPAITQNLPLFGKVTYEQGDVADTLTIAAEVSDGGTLTYQWYKDDAAIAGATESSYTPSVEVGSAVYYCVVTNTLGEANATAQSESVAIIGYVVFLAASEPVPVGTAPEINPFSMTMGWLAGSWIGAQRNTEVTPEEPAGDPVDYRYNGRLFPGLPEWTKDYEIVTIVDPNLGNTYIKAAKGYTIESSWNITYGTHHTTYGVDVVRCYLEGWEWQEPVAKTDDWLWSNSPYLNDGSTYPFWSNTDLICKNDDGTEYVGLAGSEPVPVYE